MYDIQDVTPEAHELGTVLLEAVERVQEAVSGLRGLKYPMDLLKICVEINRLENEGDAILRKSMARLFKESTDPIYIIKWKEIYEFLENALDSCEDVANLIEGIGSSTPDMSAADDLTGILQLFAAPPLVLVLIGVALAFDFINGFHDAANAIATVVSTRVLTHGWPCIGRRPSTFWPSLSSGQWPKRWSWHCATPGHRLLDHLRRVNRRDRLEPHYLARGLALQFVTCARRGLVGAGFAKAGLGALVWSGIEDTCVHCRRHLLGLASACSIWSCWHGSSAGPRPGASIVFRRGQLLSAALYSLGHGGNDAQKRPASSGASSLRQI